jgi:hypothetical protein
MFLLYSVECCPVLEKRGALSTGIRFENDAHRQEIHVKLS